MTHGDPCLCRACRNVRENRNRTFGTIHESMSSSASVDELLRAEEREEDAANQDD